jgi:hypothetical protein
MRTLRLASIISATSEDSSSSVTLELYNSKTVAFFGSSCFSFDFGGGEQAGEGSMDETEEATDESDEAEAEQMIIGLLLTMLTAGLVLTGFVTVSNTSLILLVLLLVVLSSFDDSITVSVDVLVVVLLSLLVLVLAGMVNKIDTDEGVGEGEGEADVDEGTDEGIDEAVLDTFSDEIGRLAALPLLFITPEVSLFETTTMRPL